MNIDSDKAIDIIFILGLEEFLKLGSVFVRRTLDACRILATHLLLEREATHVEDLREVKLAVDLLVAESVVIKDNPLQMNDENVWHLTKKLTLCHIVLLFATIDPDILNNLTIDHLLYTRVQVFRVLDLHGECVACRNFVLGYSVAEDLLLYVGRLEHILQQILLTSASEHILHSVEEEGEELL